MRTFFSQKIFASSFITALAIAAFECPPWISIFAFPLLMWKWGVERYAWRPIPKKWTTVLAFLLLGQVLLQYRTLLGQEASNTFLIGLAALRIMDYSNERDHRFVVLLGFILISLKALFSLDLYWIPPSIYVVIGLWYSMLDLKLPKRASILFRIFATSLPVTGVMFFAFPRIVIPWANSRQTTSAQVGFSDQLNPGSVSELAKTNEMAFRARFLDEGKRNLRSLYWRGSVLKVSDGLRWQSSRLGLDSTPVNPNSPNTLEYEVALEPNSHAFLFALDGTFKVTSEGLNVFALKHGVYRTVISLNRPVSYQGNMDTKLRDREIPTEEFYQVPILGPRTQKWVDDTKQMFTTEKDKVQALETLFSDPKFVYTVSPGSYVGDELEEFLFERKQGFCEHYAGAYATLARALGIASRVVVGYHGGVFNPIGNFWRVNQREAHAWVEIFQDGAWTRIDPTNWVAPLRINLGAEFYFNLSENEQKTFARNFTGVIAHQENSLWIDEFLFHLENVNYRWTYFLMEFDKQYQQDFWKELLESKIWTGLGFILFMVILTLLLKNALRAKKSKNDSEKLMELIGKLGATKQLARSPSEPPLQFLRRVKTAFPEHQDLIDRCFLVYDKANYRMDPVAGDLRQLVKEWKQLLS